MKGGIINSFTRLNLAGYFYWGLFYEFSQRQKSWPHWGYESKTENGNTARFIFKTGQISVNVQLHSLTGFTPVKRTPGIH
jgi:hypothetical protein